MNNLGEIIRQAIIEHDMTQKEVAKILHISPQTLSSYINNRRIPSLECFFDLVDLLDLNGRFFNPSINTQGLDAFLTNVIPNLCFEQKRILYSLAQEMLRSNRRTMMK